MNNKEIEVLKTIDAKNREARSYKDPTCYNAAYCFGYTDGATGALLTLSETQSSARKVYIVLNHYSNENIGEFNSIGICGAHLTLETAMKAADKLFAEDKENGCYHDTIPFTTEDCSAFDESPEYVIGEMEENGYESFHNFYAVFAKEIAAE